MGDASATAQGTAGGNTRPNPCALVQSPAVISSHHKPTTHLNLPMAFWGCFPAKGKHPTKTQRYTAPLRPEMNEVS